MRLLLFLLLINYGVAAEAPLGLPVTLTDIYIPGEKVAPIPRKDSSASLVIRVLHTKSAADGFRYDLSVYGLDPGTHALKDYLHYIHDQSPVTKLDKQLTVTTSQPLESLPPPEEITHTPPSEIGGYRNLLIILGVLWLLIFLAILFYKKKKPSIQESHEKELTLQERLTPLVTAAAKGDLSTNERAVLERLIFAHWKEKLPELTLADLRKHPSSSPLLLQLENWLHSPSPETTQSQISELLETFR